MRDAFQNPPPAPIGVWDGGKGRFLIDGFPRKMDQALKFDEAVCHRFRHFDPACTRLMKPYLGLRIVFCAVFDDDRGGDARASARAWKDVRTGRR